MGFLLVTQQEKAAKEEWQMASGGLLLAIAVDRFLRVCIPLKYKSIVTQKRVWIVVALCWFTAALPSFVPMFGWYNHTTWNGTTYANSTHITCSYFTVNARSYLVNVIFFVFFLPSLAVMTGLYCYIFLIARRQLRVNIGLAIMSRKYYKKEQRLATSLGLVLFLFAVCWLPILVMHTLIHYGKINVSRVTIRIAVVLSHANSAVNPIVYALKISKIREVCRKLWWKRKPSCRTEAEQSNANSTADSSDKKSSRLTNSNA
ncbi:adenosine receptor A1-like [Hoplias malabaricus]|uniref:adenosine receptor A1-like n=1 Tax=Hoplias malabaricus TaxID=27720 RepID=UPI003462716E